jgi:hypothetical protein
VEEMKMADLGEIPEIPIEIEEERPSKGRGFLKTILTVVIGVAIGGAAMYFGGPMLNILVKPGADRTVGPMIGPEKLQQEIENLNRKLDGYTVLGAVDKIKAEQDELRKRQQAQGAMGELENKLRDALDKEEEYDALTRDLENLNEKVASSQEAFEMSSRQIAEGDSRLRGLRTEIARFEDQVGKLAVADARRQAVKATLLRDVEQLIVQIQKSIPLVPSEYRKQARIDRARKIRDELESSNWVRPEVLEEYTQLYLEELQMATQENYFIAKLPLVEKNKEVMKWAECVSIGNRLTYFETLDKKFTGVCRNTNPEGAVPRYELLVDLPRTELMEVRDIMAQFRPEDFEERIRAQLGDEVELVGRRSGAAGQLQAS